MSTHGSSAADANRHAGQRHDREWSVGDDGEAQQDAVWLATYALGLAIAGLDERTCMARLSEACRGDAELLEQAGITVGGMTVGERRSRRRAEQLLRATAVVLRRDVVDDTRPVIHPPS